MGTPEELQMSWIDKKVLNLGFDRNKLYKTYDEFLEEFSNITISYEAYKKRIKRAIKRMQKDPITNFEEKIEEKESDNTYEVTSNSDGITSLEQLKEKINFDESKWTIVSHSVNKWGTNFNIDGEIQFAPIVQIKFRAIAKILEKPKFKLLQPIELPKLKRDRSKGKERKTIYKKALILSDLHIGYVKEFDLINHAYKLIPFHDRKAINSVLQLAENIQPDEIIFNGDIIDVTDWQDKFPYTPDSYSLIQPSLIETAWWLMEFRKACPKTKIIYNAGNHEDRLNKHIIRRLPQAFDLKSIDDIDGANVQSLPNLLQLHKLDVEWTGDYKNGGGKWLNESILVEHGNKVSAGSGSTIKNLIRDMNHSYIIGHIHRDEYAKKQIITGQGKRKKFFVASTGTLCLLDGKIPAANQVERLNWQQSVGICFYNNNVGGFQSVPIDNGYIYFDNKEFQGQFEDISFGKELNKFIN